MLPPVTKNPSKKLNIPKEIYASLKPNERNGFWFISWLGRSFFKENKIYREYYISLCHNTFYRFGAVKTFYMEFPEEYTLRYKQGNYYFYSGKFYGTAYSSNKMLIIENAVLKKNINTSVLSLRKLLGNGKTFYPLYNLNHSSSKLIDPYKDVPCYLVELNDKKYIIPLNVIQAYYYAYSSLSIYYLNYDILHDGLGKYYSNDEGDLIVPFKSTIINELEAYYFSKFHFLNEGKFDSFFKVYQAFRLSLINNQRNKKPLRSYIIYELPYLNDIDITLDLYCQPIDRDEKIHMVYAIKNSKLASGKPLFRTTNFLLNDIDALIKEEPEDEDKSTENTKISNIKNQNNDLSFRSDESNFNGIKNILLEEDLPIFSQSPEINKVPSNEIKENQFYSNHFINEVKKYDPKIYDQQNSTGDTGIANFNIDAEHNVPYIDVILKAFELISNNKLFSCQYLFLKRYQNSLFSYDPYSSENGAILLFQISYHDHHYCIIVRQNLLQRIGIIKRNIPENFNQENDNSLSSGLIYIFKNYNYNWAKLKTIQDSNILKYKFQVINAINKTKEGSKDERIKSLYDRITTFITNQVKTEANNQL